MNYVVYVRCYYESFYMDWFIEYYLSLGFNYIVILKCDNLELNIKNKYKDKVFIKKVKNNGDKLYDENISIIKHINNCWCLMIDIDEILFLKNNNIKLLVNNILRNNHRVNCVMFNWVMMERMDNNNLSMKQSLEKYKLFDNHLYKSLAYIPNVRNVKCPHRFNVNNMVMKKDDKLFFNYLEIEDLKKFTNKNENFILHMHTRSLNNMLLKALITKLTYKDISQRNQFKDFVENYKNYNRVVKKFIQIVGKKASLPYQHSEGEEIKIDFEIKSELWDIPLCNFENEKRVLYQLLTKMNVDLEKYEELIKCLEKSFLDFFCN